MCIYIGINAHIYAYIYKKYIHIHIVAVNISTSPDYVTSKALLSHSYLFTILFPLISICISK